MNQADIWSVAAAVITAVGGSSVLIIGLSSYLGKRWADRALEKQKQEYNQLNIAFTHQLDLATRRVQIELDAIGHLRKLRTESEFEKIRELWRCIASLQAAYFCLPKAGFVLQFADESLNKKLRIQASFDFSKRLSETYEIWSRELLSIPEDIANTAEEVINIGRQEESQAIQFPDPYDNTAMAAFNDNSRRAFWEERNKRLEHFKTKTEELLSMMRRYQRGPGGGI